MKKLFIPIFIIGSILAWTAYSDSPVVDLVVDINGNSLSGGHNVLNISAGTVLPFKVFKVENGQNAEITESSNIHINITNLNRLSIVNNSVVVKEFVQGDLINSQDLELATMMILYADEAADKFGSMTISFEIR